MWIVCAFLLWQGHCCSVLVTGAGWWVALGPALAPLCSHTYWGMLQIRAGLCPGWDSDPSSLMIWWVGLLVGLAYWH